jgi:hypothetical protein
MTNTNCNSEETITIDLSDYNMNTNSSVITSSNLDSITTTLSGISSDSIYSPTGNVSIEGELTVGGVDVMQSIKDIQRVLGVVSRDLGKEEKYKGLKRAAEAYERELAKIETFETLKESK